MAEIVGQTFNRLLVIDFSHCVGYYQYWLCKCSCGNIKAVRKDHLVGGRIKSCGCLRVEFGSQVSRKHSYAKSPTYVTWMNIKERCHNVNSISYPNYGGRGIKVCDRWSDSFENFLEDMGEKPHKDSSIERLDNNDDYTPQNCIWSNRLRQNNNKRNNIFFTLHDKTQSLADWTREFGLPYKSVWKRLTLGWSLEKSLQTPIRLQKNNRV